VAEAAYRLRCDDERYGRLCPRCAGPKTVQASECWSCYLERCRDEAYWTARTCLECGGPKSGDSRKPRCFPCAMKTRRPVRVGRPQPQDHPWR
jgi:hypothetical protein